MSEYRDLTGKRFGRLTVIRRSKDYVSPKGAHLINWECLCDCGNITYCTSTNLKRTKSCGCSKGYYGSLSNRKTNNYDLDNFDCGVGYTRKGEPFYFDKEDYKIISEYCWCYSRFGYVITDSNKYQTIKDKKGLAMHRLVLDYWDYNFDIDHINNNKSDNRKCNLRIVTRSQNFMNKKKQKNNTSGVTGVYWDKSRNKWLSSIQLNGVQKHLGRFDDKDDAIVARKMAEDKYFGEYSFDNSQAISQEMNINA